MTTEERQKEKEYKVGDKVWYLAGFVAVRCKIFEIENRFRHKDPKAHLFYWLDEPVGHAVGADDLYDTREEVEAALREDVSDELPTDDQSMCTLETQRSRTIGSIKSFYKGLHPKQVKKACATLDAFAAEHYPPKKRGEEWFNPRDLGIDTRYNVGDVVWTLANRNGVALAIRCTIRAVDDDAFQRDPLGGIIFYDLDEPLASTVSADVLLNVREDAASELKFQAEESTKVSASRGGLDEFRAGCKGNYPPKKHLEEWFGPADVPNIITP